MKIGNIKLTKVAEKCFGDDLGLGKSKNAKNRHRQHIKAKLNRIIDESNPIQSDQD